MTLCSTGKSNSIGKSSWQFRSCIVSIWLFVTNKVTKAQNQKLLWKIKVELEKSGLVIFFLSRLLLA